MKESQAVMGKTCSSGLCWKVPRSLVLASSQTFALDLARYFVSCMQAFLRIQLVAT